MSSHPLNSTKLYQYFHHLLNTRSIPSIGTLESQEYLWEYCQAVALYMWGDRDSMRAIAQTLPSSSRAGILLKCREIWQVKNMKEASAYLTKQSDKFTGEVAPFWRSEYCLVAGLIEMNTGDYEAAMNYYIESSEILSQLEIYERYGRALYNLALCQEELGLSDELEITLLRLESICEEQELSFVKPLYFQFKVMNLMERGEYLKAKIENDNALLFLRKKDFRNDEINLLLLSAQLHIRTEDFEAATNDLKAIKKLMRVRRGNIHRESVLLVEALLYATDNRLKDAQNLLSTIDYSTLDRLDQRVYSAVKFICFKKDESYRENISDFEVETLKEQLESSRDDESAHQIDLLGLKYHDQGRDAQRIQAELEKYISLYQSKNLAYPLIKAKELVLKIALDTTNLTIVKETTKEIIKLTQRYSLDQLASRYREFNQLIQGRAQLKELGKRREYQLWPFSSVFNGFNNQGQVIFESDTLALYKGVKRIVTFEKGSMSAKLMLVFQKRGRVLSTQEIFESVWQQKYLDKEYADKKVYQLLSQLKAQLHTHFPGLELIKNHPGKGYSTSITYKGAQFNQAIIPARLTLFMKSLKKGQLISSKDLINFYGYTSKSATHDLKILSKEGLLELTSSKRREKLYRVLKTFNSLIEKEIA